MPTTSSNSSSTFKSFSSSSFSATTNGQTRSYSEKTFSDPSGTRIHRTAQEPGEASREERIEYDSEGRRLQGGAEAGNARRIEDVTDKEDREEKEREKEYEERIEEEYAKREGGA